MTSLRMISHSCLCISMSSATFSTLTIIMKVYQLFSRNSWSLLSQIFTFVSRQVFAITHSLIIFCIPLNRCPNYLQVSLRTCFSSIHNVVFLPPNVQYSHSNGFTQVRFSHMTSNLYHFFWNNFEFSKYFVDVFFR